MEKNIYEIHRIIDISKDAVINEGIYDFYSDQEDINIFLNVENILNSNIEEFSLAKEIILEKFYQKIFTASVILEKHGKNSEVLKNFIDMEMNWSERSGDKGYFGSGNLVKNGKAAGKKRKMNLVLSMANIMRNIYNHLIEENALLLARMYNFYPSTVQGINVDTISDILIIIFKNEFTKFTKNKIKKLKINKKFISSNGLLLLNNKEEYFYPNTFFTNMPIIDKRDYNALKYEFNQNNSYNSMNALAKIFNNEKDKKISMLTKNLIDIKNIDQIEQLLDYRYLSSLFLSDDASYKDHKKSLMAGTKILKNITNTTNELETIINEVILAGVELYNIKLKNKDGTLLEFIKEELLQKWLYAALSLKYKGRVTQHNHHMGLGVDDIRVQTSDGINLIELKYLKDSNNIKDICKKYKTQLETYSQNANFQKAFYIIYTSSFSKEELKRLIKNLDNITHDRVNAMYKVVAINRSITASVAKKFLPNIEILEKIEDVDSIKFDQPELEEIIKLKSEYYKISGKKINTVDLDKVKKELQIEKQLRVRLIRLLHKTESDKNLLHTEISEQVNNKKIKERIEEIKSMEVKKNTIFD